MKAIFLICLLAGTLALGGCVQQQNPSYKYVCSDGKIVDSPAQCTAIECVDCSQYCEDYCAGQEEEPTVLTKEKFLEEVGKANYCTVPSDCVLPATKCPLGCYNLVNKEKQADINALVKQFKQTCYQTCSQLNDANCVGNKCVPVLFGEG